MDALPAQSALGIDQYVYTVGESFQGIKHVPPGFHVLSYAAYDVVGNRYGPVTAMFVEIPKVERGEEDACAGMDHDTAWMLDSALHGPVLGWKWNASEEILVPLDEDEMARAQGMVKNLRWDKELGSYVAMHSVREQGSSNTVSWDSFKEWVGLSNFIDGSVVDRVAPKGGNICVLAENHCSISGGRKSDAELALERQLGHDEDKYTKCAPHAGKCSFTPIPGLIKDAALSPNDLTTWNMDKSCVLEQLLRDQYGYQESLLLGELQFAFLAFLLGHSLDAFLQWKNLIALLFGCEEAVTSSHVEFFVDALDVIYKQLSFSFSDAALTSSSPGMAMNVSKDVVSEQLLESSFLKSTSISFIQSILFEQQGTMVDPRIIDIVNKLRVLLSTALHWDCGSIHDLGNNDEDGPVIVLDSEEMY